MYQFLYSEVLDDDPDEARRREREAFDQALSLLRTAEEKGVGSIETVRALHFLQMLWSILIKDLCAPENDLPKDLRAGIGSIGLWVAKEVDAVRSGTATSLADLIEINQIVRDGLK